MDQNSKVEKSPSKSGEKSKNGPNPKRDLNKKGPLKYKQGEKS